MGLQSFTSVRSSSGSTGPVCVVESTTCTKLPAFTSCLNAWNSVTRHPYLIKP